MQRIYSDTSVIGGVVDPEFKEWSLILLDGFLKGDMILVLSDATIKELIDAPVEVHNKLSLIPKQNIELVHTTDNALKLAQLYIDEKAISQKFKVDALHIALSTLNKVDILVSWNFKHIVNIVRIRSYNSVNLRNGYIQVEIRTPREVFNE